jgi:hypothetical protein
MNPLRWDMIVADPASCTARTGFSFARLAPALARIVDASRAGRKPSHGLSDSDLCLLIITAIARETNLGSLATTFGLAGGAEQAERVLASGFARLASSFATVVSLPYWKWDLDTRTHPWVLVIKNDVRFVKHPVLFLHSYDGLVLSKWILKGFDDAQTPRHDMARVSIARQISAITHMAPIVADDLVWNSILQQQNGLVQVLRHDTEEVASLWNVVALWYGEFYNELALVHHDDFPDALITPALDVAVSLTNYRVSTQNA